MTVDAAINAGNSGGPVISEGKIVGVAFQKIASASIEGQGHAVPACLIHRFLRGVEMNKDLTLPSIRVKAQALESPALRRRFGLASDLDGGVLVTETSAGPGEELALQRFDIIKAINGYDIDAFGSVSYLGHRVQMAALQDKFYVGDDVELRVYRDGKELTLKQTLLPTRFLVSRGLYDQQTPFFIMGGMVFQQLSLEYLHSFSEQERLPHMQQLYHVGVLTPERTEAVIMSQILSHQVNVGFGAGWTGSPVVSAINGTPVLDLADAFELAQKAVRESEYLEIELENLYGSSTVVMDSASVPTADAEIQQMYRLPQMASEHFFSIKVVRLDGLDEESSS
jgi:hypothetical protein